MKTLKIIFLMAIAMAIWTVCSVSAATTNNATDNTSVNQICVVASVDQGIDATIVTTNTNTNTQVRTDPSVIEFVNAENACLEKIWQGSLCLTNNEFTDVEPHFTSGAVNFICEDGIQVMKLPTFDANDDNNSGAIANLADDVFEFELTQDGNHFANLVKSSKNQKMKIRNNEEVTKIPTFAADMMMNCLTEAGLSYTGIVFTFDADITTNAPLSMNLFGSEVTKIPNWVEDRGQVVQSMMAGVLNVIS